MAASDGDCSFLMILWKNTMQGIANSLKRVSYMYIDKINCLEYMLLVARRLQVYMHI